MSESFLKDKVTLHCGDCLEVLPTLAENSVDAVCTDPPYGLQFMGREWDKLWRNETDADAAYVVKPLDLIQYLCRLVCPKGGLILDPFAGTGTTGEAAWREGMRATLIEREAEYQADIRRRMALALAGPDERVRESIKEKTKGKDMDYGPLFSRIP